MTIPLTKLIRVARNSPHPSNQHSTLVFRGGALISSGYNHDGIHSEVVALNSVWPNRLRNITIVNLMIRTKTGSFGNSRPCKNCWEYLVTNKIRKVVFFNGTKFVEELI